MRWWIVLTSTATVLLWGCREQLPACDEEAARTPVFLDADDARDGRVAYAGQALMEVSCGHGTFCHSPAAPPKNRMGAPKGLDFDVRPVDEDGDSQRLRKNQKRVHEWRHAIAETVSEGTMPPGEAGRGVRDLAPTYRMEPGDDAASLPAIDSKQGRQILENWLACGSPVVEQMKSPSARTSPGDFCGAGPQEIGDCIVRAPPDPPDPPDPNWDAIYDEVIGPRCGESCHGPGRPDQRDESALDLSTKDMAHMQLVGREAMGSDCGGSGPLVTRSMPESSLLIDKLEADPACGDRMPIGESLDSATIDAIRTWIEMGANE